MSAIQIDPEITGGAPCFRGTGVPFKNLIDYLERGQSLGGFLRQFPTVTHDLAMQSLEEASMSSLDIVPDENTDGTHHDTFPYRFT